MPPRHWRTRRSSPSDSNELKERTAMATRTFLLPEPATAGGRSDLEEVAATEAAWLGCGAANTLGEFIKERSHHLGEHTAITWFHDKRSLSYRELDECAD